MGAGRNPVSFSKYDEVVFNDNDGSIIRDKKVQKKDTKGKLKDIARVIVKNLDIRDWFIPENKKWLAIATAYILMFTPSIAKDDKIPKIHNNTTRILVGENILDVNTFEDAMILAATELSYGQLSQRFLTGEYLNNDRYIWYNVPNDTREFSKATKNYFEYPNGSVVSIGKNDTIVRWKKINKTSSEKSVYEPVAYSDLYSDDNGLIVWHSKLRDDAGNGGVYRVILPSGELIEKKYLRVNNSDSSYWYKLVSSTGEEVYYSGSKASGFRDAKTGEKINSIKYDWIDNRGNIIGTKEYICEEVFGTYGPHFGTEFGINWYDTDGKLVRTLNFETDSANRYLGYIKYLPDGLAECTWNDGTVVTYETEENIIQSCKYPNGTFVKISSDVAEMTSEEGKKVIIGLFQPLQSTPGNNFVGYTHEGQVIIKDGQATFWFDKDESLVVHMK